jgi:hypothetical protein
MPDNESPAVRYRRLAAESLEVANTFPAGDRRTALLQMAQVWQRLADDYQGATPPFFRPNAGDAVPMQQQQQAQPKDEDEKS